MAHERLSELDDLVEFLRFNGDRVRQMLRRPYGDFRELSENPAATQLPTPSTETRASIATVPTTCGCRRTCATQTPAPCRSRAGSTFS